MTTPLLTRFEAFSTEHLVLITGFLVVCVALAALGRAHRGTPLRFASVAASLC